MHTTLKNIFSRTTLPTQNSRTLAPSKRQRPLFAEQLEARRLLAADATVNLTGASQSLLGEDVNFVVTFDNTSTDPTDNIGYSPFVDIVMPLTGDAPPLPNNGISFPSGSTASYNGLNLSTTEVIFDVNGEAIHPFAKDSSGQPVIISGKPGDQLIVVELPFGSYGPTQPPIDIDFTGSISPDAQPNHAYDITATGGYRYQVDAVGNPTDDNAAFGTTIVDPVQPQLFRLKKTSNTPEHETATGPNFQHSYTVSMAVAPGQTVDNLELTDLLPDEVQFVSVGTISGNGSTTQTQTSAPSTTSPGGTLSYKFDQVIGTGNDNDVQLVFDYFVAQQDKNGQDVIPLGTGGTKTITNTSDATGLWTSANPNFPNQQTVSSDASDPNSQYVLTARTVALQKSFTDLTNPGSPKAGDEIRYTLNFQISDFFALDTAVLNDVLSDGQEFDASFTPTLTFRQQAGNDNYANEQFDPANVSTTLNPLGTQTVSFDLSEQLKALRGPTAPGSILGASIPLFGTGGSVPPTNPGGPGTTGTIVFQAKVLNDYRQTPSPGADVVEGDVMTDNAEIEATVLNYSDLTPTGSIVTNGSQKSFTLANGGSDKKLFAINGVTPTPNQRVVPGDEVTFRLEYTLPFSSIKEYKIVDYLPLPIFDPTGDLVWNGQPPSSAAPQAGQWSFGPNDTFSQAPINGPNPGNATLNANSLTWDFGTFADPVDRSGKTDILFTVTATNKPFGDGLLLTNQGQQSEVNQQGDIITSSPGIAQITVAEPELTITKGVVSTDNVNGQFTQNTVTGTTPPLPAGVTFTQPGLTGASFSGTVTSGPPGGLATTPIDATLANVAGNDLVKFAIIVENTGSSPNGAFDVTISDTYDTTKFQIPTNSTGLNLQVTNGDGTTLAYSGTDTDLFSATGIELVDPGATAGSLKEGSQLDGTVINNGENIAVITYDLQILPTVAPLDIIPNTGTIKNYASTDGGPNFANGLTDDTDVTIQGPEIAKSLVGTSIIDAFNSNTQAVIGEIATFKLDVKIPRGTTPDAVVVDSLPAGLAFQQMVGTPSIDAGISFTGSLTPVLSNDGKTVTFNLGDVTNTNVSDDLKGFIVEYEAVVLNVRSNQQNTQLTNNAKLDWLNHPELPAVTSSAVTVIEPTITVNKTVSPSTAQAGDMATFTIDISAGTTTAHDVNLKDILPGNITPVAGSLAYISGVRPTTLVSSAGGFSFEATWDTLTPGQTSRLSFEVTVDANVISGTSITNRADATWTSLGNPAQITTNNPNAFQRTGSGSTSQGQLNNYATSNSATLNIENPGVTKTLISTSIVNASNSNTQAVIGEKATYEIVVTIPQGRTPAARLIDTMRHKQLAYASSTTPVVSDPASVSVPGLTTAPTFSGNGNNNIVTWDFGDIVNTDTDSTKPETLTFQIETLVLNVNYNHQGVHVRNDAQLRWSNNSRSNNARNQSVQIIEPKLTTTKSVVVGGLGGNPGDPVTYTIEIKQDGSSATDAFNTTLRDLIPSTIASPTLTSVADTAGIVTTNNFQITGNTLTTVTAFDVEKDPAGRTITLTIDGILQGPFTANQSITNTNTIEWTSLPGDTLPITPNPSNSPFNYERTGSNSTNLGQLNNYKTNDSATFTVNTADLRVSKTVSDPTPNVGDTITFTVTVTNAGPNVATGIELTDTFPTSGLSLNTAGIVESQGSYDPGTGIWTIGTLAKGASVTLDLPATVLAPAAGTIPSAQTNTAEITAVVEPDPLPGNNKATATETPKYADLAVVKQTSNPTPNDGDTVTYTITLTNNGKDTATNVELTDTLPSPVSYQSVVTITPGTTFNPTGTPIITGGIWSVPSIDPGDVFTLEFQVIANAGGLSYNEIEITKTDTWDPDLGNNSSRTPINPQDADVSVQKVVNNPTPQVGDNVTFTITVKNNGPDTAKNVQATDNLPPLGFQIVGTPTPSIGTYDIGTGVWTIGDMIDSQTATLDIVATVLAPSASTGPGSSFTNTAEANSIGPPPTPDPNPGNNTNSASVTPLQSDLAIAKGVTDATPNVGDTISFIIGAANYGPADATQVVVTDVIPSGLTYIGPTSGVGTNPTVGSLAVVGNTVTWTIGPIATNEYPLFAYDVTVDAPSPDGIPPALKNSATITGREYDPDSTNNTASVLETPQYADLEVDKQINDPTPNVGDVLTYTITVTNNGKDNAENVQLTDTLPSLTGLSIVGTPVTSAGTFDPISGIWDIGTIYQSSPATLLVQAEVLAPATGNPLPQTNTATITSVTQYDPDPTNDFDTATETPQYADLRVEKNVNTSAPNVGDTIFFDITVENLGANQATDVTVDDVLPAGLSFVSASSTDYDPGTGIWNVGTVDVGTLHAKALQITAIVAASGRFTNEAEVSTTNPPDQFDPDLTNNKGSATVVTREADLLVEKSVNDATPNVGDIITFTIDVTNNGPDVANNVEITDQLPTAGLAFISSTATQGSYNSGTGIWDVGTVDVGVLNTQTLTIDARVLAPARTTAFTIPPAQTNVAEVTNVDEHDPDPLNNRSEVTETPKYADLSVEKITTNVQPNVGDTFIYTVTLKNNGVDTATNVEVTELFPNNISVISVTPTNTHTTTRFNQTATGGIWSVPTIAPADFEVLTILAEATSASVAYNVVTINHSDVWDPNLDNNQARTPTDPQQADLVVTKTVDTPRPEVNDNVTFTIAVENLGPTTAQNVTVADPLPTGLSFVSAVPPADYDETTGIWTVGTLADPSSPPNTRTLTITAKVLEPASGSGLVSQSINTATATSTTVDPNPGNNSGTATVNPLQADLAITKTASNLKPQIGTTFNYTIEVSNLGPDTASNVIVNDLLQAGVQYQSDTSGGAYVPGTGIWTIGPMNTGDRQTLTITALVTIGNSGGAIPNTATVGSGTWDPDLSNNTATITVVVPPRGVIVGTDIGCETGPFVRVIDPDTGADRITPFFAYEPDFRGGARVYGADVTGDGEPDIITAPGPGRPGEVKVWEIKNGKAVENPAYNFFPFGPGYTGGVEISEGSITAAGKTEIVAAQNFGGLVSVFEVTPGAANPINATPVRQVRPFGSSYLGGVTIDTADVGTVNGSTVTSQTPDGITELFVGSGFGIQAQIKGYNGTTASPTLFNSFNVMSAGYSQGVSVARLPSSTAGSADRILVSSGIDGNAQVETYNGATSSRDAVFQAYGNGQTQVFSAAIDDDALFNVQGVLGTANGVQKSLDPDGAGKSTLQQSTVSYPPLRVAILRN